jgi:hypothetical protein
MNISPDLESIIENAPSEVGIVLGDLTEEIQRALALALEEGQASETGKTPVVSVGVTLKIDPGKSPLMWQVIGKVTQTHKAEGDVQVCDDPRQPKLPGLEGGAKVTISANGSAPVDVTDILAGKRKGKAKR